MTEVLATPNEGQGRRMGEALQGAYAHTGLTSYASLGYFLLVSKNKMSS